MEGLKDSRTSEVDGLYLWGGGEHCEDGVCSAGDSIGKRCYRGLRHSQCIEGFK